MVSFRESTKEDVNRIHNFYESVGDTAKVSENDSVLLAEKDGGLVGVVRLCKEHTHFLLRGMSVHPKYQQQGIGTELLLKFDTLISNKTCWCIARDDLEHFYSRIGFCKIEPSELPVFLQQEVSTFNELGHEVLCLVKYGI